MRSLRFFPSRQISCPARTCEPSLVRHRKTKAGAGTTATKLVYAPCGSGATVVLWKLSGSGHVWPGRDAHLVRMLGQPNHLIDANEEMWTFFRNAHR
jgi:poly(3-hydroxybutyrate) depolymerase